MIEKKSQKANLEKKRTIFVEVGLIIALAVVFFAFEYKSYDKFVIDIGEQAPVSYDEDTIINTQQDEPPPPQQEQPQTTVLEIVEDNVDVDDDIDIDAETDQEAVIENWDPPVVQEKEVVEPQIFIVVEQMPSFPGGEAARMKYLQDNVDYPQMAKESGISGTVYLTFVVESDGSITHVEVQRGIAGGCDEEAVRVVKNMPKWTPGKQRGKPVRVQFNMPIKFTLSGG